MEEKGSFQYRSLFWPILLIGVGVVWLLGNLGYIPMPSLRMLIRLWPLILIVITVVLSLLYAIQYFAGSPIRLAVVNEITDMVLSPNSSIIAAGADDGTVRLWDTRFGWAESALSGHRGPVTGVAFTPDSSTLISAGRDGIVLLWDVANAQIRQELDAGGVLGQSRFGSRGLAHHRRRSRVLPPWQGVL